jgi:hypothetical protein
MYLSTDDQYEVSVIITKLSFFAFLMPTYLLDPQDQLCIHVISAGAP